MPMRNLKVVDTKANKGLATNLYCSMWRGQALNMFWGVNFLYSLVHVCIDMTSDIITVHHAV